MPVFYNTQLSTVQQLSCNEPLGMGNMDIHDSQITSSSAYDGEEAYRSRPQSVGWRPSVYADSWLQINLLRQTIVTGVDTLGRDSLNHYITRYRVTTSLDGVNWNNVTDEEGESEVKFN